MESELRAWGSFSIFNRIEIALLTKFGKDLKEMTARICILTTPKQNVKKKNPNNKRLFKYPKSYILKFLPSM